MSTNTLHEPPPSPPDQQKSHVAIGLHCKIFEAWPDWIWHNKQSRWLHSADPETAILRYEDQVRGWFLKWASHLREKHDAGFVVLMVAVSYLEGNQQYREGESSEGNKSKRFFCTALRRLFPLLTEEQAKDLYAQVRCGLFHDGMTRKRVLIENREPEALRVDGPDFVISPNKLLDRIVADFDAYLADLRAPSSQTLAPFLKYSKAKS